MSLEAFSRITLAAVLCLATGAALANSPVVSLVSGWMPDASYTSIADEARMEAKLGYDVRLPEALTEDFTEEQYAAEERGEMFLSVGSAEYEETIYQTAGFELDGVAYSIGMDDYMADWSAEDFFTAAQTVIEAE